MNLPANNKRRSPAAAALALIAAARAVISDGGSNQEELSYLGVPTVLFRSRSERPDGLGANVVLRSDIGMSIADYARSGAIDALRRPTAPGEPVSWEIYINGGRKATAKASVSCHPVSWVRPPRKLHTARHS